MTINQIILEAQKIAVLKDSENGCAYGGVGSVIQTVSKKIFKGVSVDCACGVGFCAEHSAIAAMLLGNETEIELIVAVNCEGKIFPPCGRCRELIFQVDKRNLNSLVIVSENSSITLRELLPLRWQEAM
jgi:cytidine deaminase